ncbi:MAG: hypothetical protein V3S30_11880, partial [Thermoanaerobaculia bacterium]
MRYPQRSTLGRSALRTFVGLLLLGPTIAWSATEVDRFIDPGDKFRRSTGAWKGRYAFENVSVISMVEGARPILRRRTVLVKDGYIVEIGKRNNVEIPAKYTVINGRNRYLLPGLIDSHVHIW